MQGSELAKLKANIYTVVTACYSRLVTAYLNWMPAAKHASQPSKQFLTTQLMLQYAAQTHMQAVMANA